MRLFAKSRAAPDTVRRHAFTVLARARNAGIDEREPLWPLLLALVGLTLRLDRRVGRKLTHQVAITIGVFAGLVIGAVGFVAGIAHERAVYRATLPRLEAALWLSGSASAATWADLALLNDATEAVARCEPMQTEVGVLAWRSCWVPMRVPNPSSR